ncbi:Rho termination factor N-terminal domain-containing protein, partial [Angustibacter speluncae]
MTDTTTTAAPADSGDAATRGALSGLRLPQLQALASELGVKGTSKMRKGDLLEAIRSHQGGGASANGSAPRAGVATAAVQPATERPARRSRRAVAA